MKFKVIIVEPKYQINLGYIARTCRNFGINRLFIVKPRAKIGKKAIMFSKHASDLLVNAKIYRSVESAISDCDVVVGTTGLWSRGNSNFKKIYAVKDVARNLSRISGSKTAAILIGRDDTGLNKNEIALCDMLAYIPTNPEYPVLNISHALGIILFVLLSENLNPQSQLESRRSEMELRKERKYLFKVFEALIKKKRIKNKNAVRNVFRQMVHSSQPTRQEVHALITALK